MNSRRRGICVVWGVLGTLVLAHMALASTTDGTIDSTNKYAWGDQIGWVNFGNSGGNVHITDSAVTGYAWSVNFGWINLDPAQSGVTNNSEGDLSGYAWGEKLGWIDFGGVGISSTGTFTGLAVISSTPKGSISFDCSNCRVVTDWRPASVRSSGGGTTGTGTTGGGGTGYYLPPQYPPITSSTPVTPTIDPQAPPPSPPIAGVPPDTAPPASPPPQPGAVVPPIASPPSQPSESVWGRIRDFFGNLFLPPKPTPPIATYVPKTPQAAFRGPWNLLPVEAIRRFVFAPLPPEFAQLQKELPPFGATLNRVGIARMTDVPTKLVNVKLTVPGLTESAGASSTGQFALPVGIPLAQLSPEFKAQIPKEIVFARAGGEKVDFPIGLALNSQGVLEKRIRTVVGTSLNLAVKPSGAAHGVKGYLVLKTRLPEERTGLNAVMELFTRAVLFEETAPEDRRGMPLHSLLGSVFLTQATTPEPASEATYRKIEERDLAGIAALPATIENRYALQEFEYADPDNDGIYTANVSVPRVDGEYEIITLISYKDPNLGTREIRLATIVDPEGYVFEKRGNKEVRIPDAIVSLYVQNPITETYELWPAREYHQENPHVTDVRGAYAFLVPPGNYYLAVSAPGYKQYKGEVFAVSEGNEVHSNIELVSAYPWLTMLDWKTALLIVVVMLLLYNFYRDRRRDKATQLNIPA